MQDNIESMVESMATNITEDLKAPPSPHRQ